MKRSLILLAFLPLFGYSQIKVSEMTPATSVNPTDVFLLIQGGSSKKVDFSVFDYGESEVGIQIGDSLIDYRVEVANQIHDSIPVGSTITIGTQYQIPIVNSTGTDFEYSSSLSWNGTSLKISKGTRNVFIGDGSGTSTTGADNTFVGHQSGNSNIVGNSNTFFGSNSGFSNTSGNYNVFNGDLSGFSNTTGERNIFIGYTSGASNTIGSYNIFNGYGAGYNNISGNNNIFVGYQSGLNSNTGSDNTFVGYKSGYLNTTGYSNTFYGYSAGYSNTTGYNNIFLGYLSGYSNTIGINNAFYGFNSGKANTTGSDNLFNGAYSGYSNTTGVSNVFLGGYAGYNNISGSSNVFLGYRAGQNETGSNKLYITNSATDTLIYGEFDNDSLHINANVAIDGNIYADNIAPLSGSQYQIPYLNVTGTGFDVSNDIIFKDDSLKVIGVINATGNITGLISKGTSGNINYSNGIGGFSTSSLTLGANTITNPTGAIGLESIQILSNTIQTVGSTELNISTSGPDITFTADTTHIVGHEKIDSNLYVYGRLIINHYDAAGYLGIDSTITTSATTSYSRIGEGENDKFIYTKSNGFALDGDTLYFVKDADDKRDSVEFHVSASMSTAASSVNKTVTYALCKKSIGESVYIFFPETVRKTRTQSADVFVTGPALTTYPIFLKDGDKLQIHVKLAASTATIFTEDVGFYLEEHL